MTKEQTPSTNSEISDAALVDQLRRLVDDQEGGDAVVLVQRQLFNRVVGRLDRLSRRSASNTAGGGVKVKPLEWGGDEPVAWVTADILAAMKRGERAVPGWKQSADFCIPLYAGTHPATPVSAEVTEAHVDAAARIISPNCMWDAGFVNNHMERRRNNARAKARAALAALDGGRENG